MPVMIQIRNVPDDVHRRLKARAALEGKSLSEFLLGELSAIAGTSTIQEVADAIAELPPTDIPEGLIVETIRKMRDGG